jgi:hypothetical protein
VVNMSTPRFRQRNIESLLTCAYRCQPADRNPSSRSGRSQCLHIPSSETWSRHVSKVLRHRAYSHDEAWHKADLPLVLAGSATSAVVGQTLDLSKPVDAVGIMPASVLRPIYRCMDTTLAKRTMRGRERAKEHLRGEAGMRRTGR